MTAPAPSPEPAKVYAWPEERARLLRTGYMCAPIYSSRPAREIAETAWGYFVEAAELMDLGITEPGWTEGYADNSGGRIVDVRVGVFDPNARHAGHRPA